MTADVEPKWWGTHRTPPLDRLTAIVHEALFAEDPERGPVFRWAEAQLVQDDDPYLGCAADQVAFTLLDKCAEVAALLMEITADVSPAAEHHG